MQKYLCEPCGYIYDPEEGDPDNGIAPGTEFENIPDDWMCPLCGLGKDAFVPVEDQFCKNQRKQHWSDFMLRKGACVGK